MTTETDIAQEMERTAGKLVKAVIKKVYDGVPPANKPATIKRKGSSKTLIDQYDLVGSIDKRITVDGDTLAADVGIFDEEIANYASANEFGVPKNTSSTDPQQSQKIPTRSFLRSTFDEEIDDLASDFEDRTGELLEKEWFADIK